VNLLFLEKLSSSFSLFFSFIPLTVSVDLISIFGRNGLDPWRFEAIDEKSLSYSISDLNLQFKTYCEKTDGTTSVDDRCTGWLLDDTFIGTSPIVIF
jgi:hypothetical protein